jgi:hypothetical protein
LKCLCSRKILSHLRLCDQGGQLLCQRRNQAGSIPVNRTNGDPRRGAQRRFLPRSKGRKDGFDFRPSPIFMGVNRFDMRSKPFRASRSSLVGSVIKQSKTTNAEDNTSDLLAEAEFICNNADEFLVGVESEELLAA